MNVPAALAHLAAAGIEPDHVEVAGFDPDDPASVRTFVDAEIDAINDLDYSTPQTRRSLPCLRAARELLLSDGERAADEALAARMRASMETLYDNELPACSRAA